VLLAPIVGESRLLGAFAVAAPVALDGAALHAIELAAEAIAARVDHSERAVDSESLRARLAEIDRLAEEKSDEVLKLSEALFAQDIELLKNTERLGQIEKLKNDFIEKMSRELRTPLNSIIESIIAVLAGENDVLSETAQGCLRRALDDGTAFLRTLQNILDLWRIKQGEMPVETQDVNFREVVEEAIFSVQDTIGNSPIAIEKHFEEPLPKIRTDLAKVNQILFLLLDNAAKFTREGRIDISARVADGELVCEVKDTGIGICPDDQQFIFDEFYQVDELASTKYRGSGLGLALVRDLLKLLGGAVAVSSEVGVGSSFSFRVPVQPLG
jgi:signal transduction histidine kinase